MKKSILALLLICFMLFSSACSPQQNGPIADNSNSSSVSLNDTDKAILLSQDFSAKDEIQEVSLNSTASKTAASFSYELFKNAYSDSKNTLISPVSIMYALAMAQNGAEGNTLSQMETAFGADRETLNTYLKSYLSTLPQSDATLSLSQSVWVKSNDNIKQSFLQTNADYFNADIYSAPMNHETVKKINDWVKQKTDGEIENAINDLSPADLLVLVNATLFEGKWEQEYLSSSIRDGVFYNLNNSEAEVTYLYSTEDIYLEGEGYSGFVKPYAGERFAFAALLPDSDCSLSKLISSLDAQELSSAIKNAYANDVSVCIPEFSLSCDTSLIELLKQMGITDAFSEIADFSAMSDNSIFISEAEHKATIKLNRYGTKAAATTTIKATRSSITDKKSVLLNRPFLYVIYDIEADMPAFIGTVTNLS